MKRLELLTKQTAHSRTFENLYPTLMTVAQVTAKTYDRSEDLRMSIDEGLSVINDHHAERLFQEMLDNAFKFSQPGNIVMVKWCFVESDAILEVRNQGEGVPSESLEVIKHALTEPHLGAHEKYWGLRIIQQISNLYHGTLSIESAPSKGWTIRVYFPNIIPVEENAHKAAMTGAPFPY